ncbi:MAG: hypothetical protein LRY51_12210, partial [Geovibrio sp.]|nr:hypothetical protein [Geovibrio sp.]
ADNYNLLGDKANMELSLDTAAGWAEDVHTAGTADDTNATAESSYFRALAMRYYTVPDIEKAKKYASCGGKRFCGYRKCFEKNNRKKKALFWYMPL